MVLFQEHFPVVAASFFYFFFFYNSFFRLSLTLSRFSSFCSPRRFLDFVPLASFLTEFVFIRIFCSEGFSRTVTSIRLSTFLPFGIFLLASVSNACGRIAKSRYRADFVATPALHSPPPSGANRDPFFALQLPSRVTDSPSPVT